MLLRYVRASQASVRYFVSVLQTAASDDLMTEPGGASHNQVKSGFGCSAVACILLRYLQLSPLIRCRSLCNMGHCSRGRKAAKVNARLNRKIQRNLNSRGMGEDIKQRKLGSMRAPCGFHHLSRMKVPIPSLCVSISRRVQRQVPTVPEYVTTASKPKHKARCRSRMILDQPDE